MTGFIIDGGSTLLPMRVPYANQQKRRAWENLYICLVSKGSNEQTVERSTRTMCTLQVIDPRIQFILLIDGECRIDHLNFGVRKIVVPVSFNAVKAKYKARALEFFRIEMQLSFKDWVLHLDEETLVDQHCVMACMNFIECSEFEWGQGVIAYNTTNYWYNSLLTYMEISRFRDDLARFRCMYSWIHMPIWGCHGSFLLTSGTVENIATWDTDCLAEDTWFTTQAWLKAGLGGGLIPSVAREQSNWTITDFLKQRRRWLCGLWNVERFGMLNVIRWFASSVDLPLACFNVNGLLRIPLWLRKLQLIHIGFSLASVTIAMIMSDMDAGVHKSSIIFHVLMVPILSIGSGCLQVMTVGYSIVWPARSFHVVQKR